MRTYLAKRLLLIVPTLLGVASLVFVIMRVIPGDVALLILGGDSGQIDRAQLAAMHRQLGLDQPLVVQFGTWLWGVVRFDFGMPQSSQISCVRSPEASYWLWGWLGALA